MNFLSMFKEQDGKWSSQRVILIVVTLFWTLTIGAMWIFSSYKSGMLQSIPDSVILLYSSISGIAIGSKVISSATKKSGNNDGTTSN